MLQDLILEGVMVSSHPLSLIIIDAVASVKNVSHNVEKLHSPSPESGGCVVSQVPDCIMCHVSYPTNLANIILSFDTSSIPGRSKTAVTATRGLFSGYLHGGVPVVVIDHDSRNKAELDDQLSHLIPDVYPEDILSVIK